MSAACAALRKKLLQCPKLHSKVTRHTLRPPRFRPPVPPSVPAAPAQSLPRLTLPTRSGGRLPAGCSSPDSSANPKGRCTS